MIAEFQDPETAPAVFILSLRAGGVGLNLTKANHVFHFDRWWNPAVEDQATDRAFRIGQRKNVFVHKFVALGTMEERIDAMIEDKKRLSSLVVGSRRVLADRARQRDLQGPDRAARAARSSLESEAAMAQFSRTWWGQRFLEAPGAVHRPGAAWGAGARTPAAGASSSYTIANGTVKAQVRGSINPYFGVYEEPIYTTTIRSRRSRAADWTRVIERIASRADLVTRLLQQEMPDHDRGGLRRGWVCIFLPHSAARFHHRLLLPGLREPLQAHRRGLLPAGPRWTAIRSCCSSCEGSPAVTCAPCCPARRWARRWLRPLSPRTCHWSQ